MMSATGPRAPVETSTTRFRSALYKPTNQEPVCTSQSGEELTFTAQSGWRTEGYDRTVTR
jgi:hypothetical protein